MNEKEKDMVETQASKNNVTFPNDRTVKTLNDNNSYNFDKVYRSDTT